MRREELLSHPQQKEPKWAGQEPDVNSLKTRRMK